MKKVGKAKRGIVVLATSVSEDYVPTLHNYICDISSPNWIMKWKR